MLYRLGGHGIKITSRTVSSIRSIHSRYIPTENLYMVGVADSLSTMCTVTHSSHI